jgi:hypothetical protein
VRERSALRSVHRVVVGESKTQSVCRVKILVWMDDACHPVKLYLISISLEQTLANDVTLNADRAAMPRYVDRLNSYFIAH